MIKNCSPCLTIKLAALALLSAFYWAGEAVAASDCCSPTSTGPLQTELDTRANNFEATAPEAMKQTFANGIDHVKHSDAMKTAKRTGATAPDFTLPDANGNEVSLSALLEDGPVVVVWYRGGWCPYCNIQLSHMQKALPELKEAGAQLIAISPDTPDKTLTTEEKNELEYFVVSDLGNQVAREYGIVYKLDDKTHDILEKRLNISDYSKDDSGELPLAVTYVIDQDGVIAWDFVNADYKKRAEPTDVVKAVKALPSKTQSES